MASYKKIEGKNGIRYMDTQKKTLVKAADVPEEVKDALENLDAGVEVDENGVILEEETQEEPQQDGPTESTEEDEEVEEASTDEEGDGLDEDLTARVRAAEQSPEGMGYPMVNGKTVDIFDMKTPHTEVRYVNGHTVPLSEKNYKTKSVEQIIQRLREIGKIS